MRTRARESKSEEGGGSRLPRERARHLISEIPNIFKSTGAAAAAAADWRWRDLEEPSFRPASKAYEPFHGH